MNEGILLMVAPPWRGELQRAEAAQGLVIVSRDAGALTLDGAGARLCHVLNTYALSTLSISTPPNPTTPTRRSYDDSGDWHAGFDGALRWLENHDAVRSGAIGLFGEDAAALAALRTAAGHIGRVDALVACSGPVEQAGAALDRVRAATLLLVGGLDAGLLEGHREALSRLRGPCRLEAIPGASRRFVEPGAFDTVAHLAGSWLRDHLDPSRRH